ncbi:hypothetical protein B296_00013065 [Ensete ventricosum]|uniref:Uncharacterized protein n=1 Tax=Ensete ventricosum TaxID=4639 RepID=A0A427AWJ8_ENSVE|nr:hypothetical protein B296_00013065 [Ensete ventricosum]
MGSLPADLGGLLAVATQKPGTGGLPAYPGRFNRLVSKVRAVYPSALGGLPVGSYWSPPYFQGMGSLTDVHYESYGLLLAISRRVPNELPNPFDKSPSKLPARFHRIVQSRPDAQA